MADEDLFGTGDQPEPSDPTPDPEPTGDSPEPAAPAPDGEIDWNNPASILAKGPAELHPVLKQFQGSFTRSTQKLAKEREQLAEQREAMARRQADLDFLDRYRSDPAFRQQVLDNERRQAQPGQPGQADPRIQSMLEASFTPEFKWLAPQLAPGVQSIVREIVQEMVGPIVQQTQGQHAKRINADWQAITEEMTTKYPGWNAREDELKDLLDFLYDGETFRHPRFGNKLEMIYRMLTADASATAAAARRMGDSARSRSTTGVTGRQAMPNIAERILNTPNQRDAMRLAFSNALEEHQRQGVTLEE